jgi:hypothetical protein
MRGSVAKKLRQVAKVEAKPGMIDTVYEAKKKAYRKVRFSTSQNPIFKPSRRQQRLNNKIKK